MAETGVEVEGVSVSSALGMGGRGHMIKDLGDACLAGSGCLWLSGLV